MSHAGSASLPWAAPKSCAVECATYRHSSRGTMEDVQRGESRLRLHAIAEIDRKADIPGPQRVASLAMALARLVGLHDAMHREGARAFEPLAIGRPDVELQERVAIATGAVTQVCALGERPGRPDRLAGRKQQVVELARREVGETHHEAGSAMAELQQPLLRVA